MNRSRLLITLLAGTLAVGLIASFATGQATGPWIEPDTGEATENIPELIPVLDRNGEHQVGYIRREVLFPELTDAGPGTPFQAGSNDPQPVTDAGGNLVGHVFAGIGFVSLEEQAALGGDVDSLRSTTATTVVGAVPED
ncbi:MAG: hypothetical protein ACRDWX_12635 [Acidimicrobiia bacterium]